MNKATATRKANALLKKMKGKNWKKAIDKNFDQYTYYVYNGGLQIYPLVINNVTMYQALLNSDPECVGGEVYWESLKSYADPNEAVMHQLATAELFIKKSQKAIKTLQRNLKGE